MIFRGTQSRKEAATTQRKKEKSVRIHEIGIDQRLLAFKMTTITNGRVACVDSRGGGAGGVDKVAACVETPKEVRKSLAG